MTPGLCLVLSGILFTIAHSFVKSLPHLPATEIAFARALVSLVLSYVWLRSVGVRPWGRNKPMLILRGFFGTCSVVLYMFTLLHMPLASAITLNYLTPIFTALVSWAILSERPRWFHWVLMSVSFLGVLLVRGFDARVTGIELAAGVGSAAFAAVAYSLVRKLRNEDHPLVVVFYFTLMTILMVLPFAGADWALPRGRDWIFLGAIGVFTQGAQYYMTRAYQGAPAASISNLNYLTVVYAIAIGWFIFHETLQPLAVVGIAIIVLSAGVSARLALRRPLPAPPLPAAPQG